MKEIGSVNLSHGVHHCNAVRGHKEALQQHNCENNVVIGDNNPNTFHMFSHLADELDQPTSKQLPKAEEYSYFLCFTGHLVRMGRRQQVIPVNAMLRPRKVIFTF